MDGDEGEVAAGGRDECGAEHVPCEVVLVGDFEREHGTGCRRFEDGGDPGRRAGDQEEPALLRGEESRETLLQGVSDGRAEVQRRTLEPHRRATAEGRDAGDHACDECPQRERVFGVVEGVEVLVGSRGRGRRSDPPQRERGNAQSHERRERNRPKREAADVLQAARHRGVEPGYPEAGEGTDDRGQEDRLARPAHEPAGAIRDGADVDAIETQRRPSAVGIGHAVQPSFHASSGVSPAASPNAVNASTRTEALPARQPRQDLADLVPAASSHRVDQCLTGRSQRNEYLASTFARMGCEQSAPSDEPVAQTCRGRLMQFERVRQGPDVQPAPRTRASTSARYCTNVTVSSTAANDRAATPISTREPTRTASIERSSRCRGARVRWS